MVGWKSEFHWAITGSKFDRHGHLCYNLNWILSLFKILVSDDGIFCINSDFTKYHWKDHFSWLLNYFFGAPCILHLRGVPPLPPLILALLVPVSKQDGRRACGKTVPPSNVCAKTVFYNHQTEAVQPSGPDVSPSFRFSFFTSLISL